MVESLPSTTLTISGGANAVLYQGRDWAEISLGPN